MHPGITAGAAIALTAACHAGTPFTVTSASYSVSATAQGDYNESDSSTTTGPVGLSVGQRVSGQYDVDASLSGFTTGYIRTSASANSSTFGFSTVACSTHTNASLVFEVPVDSHAVLRSEGGGGAGWQATANEGATASFTATLSATGGVLIQRSAGNTSEVFVSSVNLPAGSYTLSLTSTTTSTGDPTTTTTSSAIVAGGIRLDIASGFGPCNPADLAEPFDLLDLADITAFATGFLAMHPIADLVADGLFDLSDINAFVTAFTAGCP